MEHLTYQGNQKKIEGFLLVMYTIYTAGIIISAARPSLENWIDFTLIGILASCWILFICKYKNYKFRATYTSFMMQISLILYAFYERELRMALPVYIVFVVMVGLYGIAENIVMTVITTGIIFGYHIMVIQTIPLTNLRDVVSFFQRISNVLFVEFLVYVWTKRNYEGSKQLLDVIEELERVESMKDDFVANVSHEIRTPINTICGMNEVLLHEELSEDVREKVMAMQNAGRNLMGVVSDILDFSELQSGEIELEEEAYNISSTINDVINMAVAYKKEKEIELIVDCDPNIPCGLIGDEKKLRRIILKLLSNAIKFTESGCVALQIGFRKETYGVNLVITIRDTGIGIREESLENLFTSFHQVDASRNRQEGGLGLGLAISQALVQKMGGAITVKSKWGKGTTVRVAVPQKVLDEKPIVALQNKVAVNVATYIDMEQFEMLEISDEYSRMILNMAKKLRGRCQVCRSFAELQRRFEKEHFSHVFISNVEYKENASYFDDLAKKTRLIVVLDQKNEKDVPNSQIAKIYKPFYILTIASILNSEKKESLPVVQQKRVKLDTRNAHVLVVDDNLMNIRVVEEMLSTYNIKVTKADSGEEALEKIVEKKYDFVFMDYMMPEMDGVETLHRIRQKNGEYYQTVPIIALTANTVAGTREQLLREGFNDFLEKPMERSVLERVLRRNLPIEKIFEQVIDTEEEKAKKALLPKKEVVETVEDWEQFLIQKGLDVKKAIRYCNGQEAYLKILRGYCKEVETILKQLEAQYKENDWKNYTIVVHGLKSSMYSVGATAVADMAKKLELAGKNSDVTYIMTYHTELIMECRKLFAEIKQCKAVYREEENKSRVVEVKVKEKLSKEPLKKENLQEISEEELLLILESVESAMYNLDEDKMKTLLGKLKNCSYQGRVMEDVISNALHKIEMSDYMTAVEMLIRWKEQIIDEEQRKCGKS